MSRDLDNKDTLNQQLKGKISDLEDRFEETRQEYNNCLISRESIEQQKMDLERELTVANFFKYFQKKTFRVVTTHAFTVFTHLSIYFQTFLSNL